MQRECTPFGLSRHFPVEALDDSEFSDVSHGHDWASFDDSVLEKKTVFNRNANKSNGVFPVRPNLTKLRDCSTLKPGDHITWNRPYVIWHHTIVVNVDTSANRVEVFHYTTVKGEQKKAKIVKEWINFDNQLGIAYRVNYATEVTDDNSAEQVLKRAYSRLEETKYSLTENNCETFASFCKTGDNTCNQFEWFKEKGKETLGVTATRAATELTKICTPAANEIMGTITTETLKNAGKKVVLAKGLEIIGKSTRFIGPLSTCVMEGGFMARDIYKMHSQKKNGGIKKEVFNDFVKQRVSEGIFGCVLNVAVGAGGRVLGRFCGTKLGAWIGGTIGSVLPGVGTAVGAIVESVIGAVVGRVVGSFFGWLLKH